jgi:hypothetical protein
MKRNHIYLGLVLTLFASCHENNKNCSSFISRYYKDEYRADGCYLNDLEDGEWSYYNSSNTLIMKGRFEKGVRVGNWVYPNNGSDSVINWKRFEKNSLHLLFSVPVMLTVAEDSLEYIKFTNGNLRSNIFNLVLTVGDLDKTQKSVYDHFQRGQEELKAMGVDFTCKRDSFTNKNRTFYLSEYNVMKESNSEYGILHFYSLVNGMLVEISCRFSTTVAPSARIIFFSVLTNCFYQNERLMDVLEIKD